MTHTWERRAETGSRGLVLVFILLGHVGFFWMLNDGLVSGSKIAEQIISLIDVSEPEPTAQPADLPPPPPVPLEVKTKVDAPVIEVAEVLTPPGSGAITAVVEQPSVPTHIVQEVVKKIVFPKSDPRWPVTQPPYPPASVRLGEEGLVVLELYVLEDGRIGDAKVHRSSGHPRLDRAALEEAKGAWRLLPGTEDGQPKAMRYRFAVSFKLRNAG